jgi:predicted metal-binding membrane protein
MHGHPHAAAGLAPLALMWLGMMAAMMAPAAWPWLLAFRRFAAGSHGRATAATAQFASGYLLAWLGYGVAAALLQRALEQISLMPPSRDAVVPPLAAGILVLAGLYQLAPLKRACLTHCRTPLGYFLTRWRNGPMAAVRMGLHHGLFCVGCCWALMATAFAVGVMNVWWMAALALTALVEQIAPQGQRLRVVVGGLLLAAGVLRAGVLR